MHDYDVLVLGAGMVGLGTALALQERGRSVAIVDRRGPAEETSFGNAGLIQSEAVLPYAFPRALSVIGSTLADRRGDARVDLKALPGLAPWLLAYAMHSGPAAVARTAAANLPLVRSALAAHRPLLTAAGVDGLTRGGGYLQLYRSDERLEIAAKEAERVHERYGVVAHVVDRQRLSTMEPHLSDALAGAIHCPEPVSVSDPGEVGRAYAELFVARGGALLRGDARSLTRVGQGWRLEAQEGAVAAENVVIALGPWSDEVLARHARRVPLRVKRGYHMHYAAKGNAVLNHFVFDVENGYALTAMKRGFRLTTGAEFAARDKPPTPRQLARVEPAARALFPLGERRDEAPWMGARPCLPDLLPMIGPVPGQAGLWANFGHHHLGFTLGPTTGRLLAQMMVGESPFTDPAPYRVDRFALTSGAH